jgi:hypothetical protein
LVAGVKIGVTTHERLYDPRNAKDRHSLISDANDSEYESAKTSHRGRRTAAANAVAGRPTGRIPYGYMRQYDPATKQAALLQGDGRRQPRDVVDLRRTGGQQQAADRRRPPTSTATFTASRNPVLAAPPNLLHRAIRPVATIIAGRPDFAASFGRAARHVVCH